MSRRRLALLACASVLLGGTGCASTEMAPQPGRIPDEVGPLMFSDGVLWAVPPGGASARRVGSAAEDALAPAWAPDFRRIAFVRQTTGPGGSGTELWTIDADGGNPQRLVANTGENSEVVMDPVWSPNGSAIAYTGGFAGSVGGIHVVPSSGAGTGDGQQLNVGLSYAPAWRPDGTLITFTEEGRLFEVSSELEVPPERSRPAPLCPNVRDVHTASRWTGSGLAWAPDGGELLYVGGPTQESAVLKVLDPESCETGVLVDDLHVTSPAWSSDGKWIAFLGRIGPGETIHPVIHMIARNGQARFRIPHKFVSNVVTLDW